MKHAGHMDDHHPIPGLDDPRAILESMGDAFYAVDSDWRFVYANRRALEFWGVAADSVIGRVIWERFPKVAGSVVEQGLRQARAEQRTVVIEAPSPITGAPVSATYCPSGTGACAYWRDISERIATEQALRRSEEHLRLSQEAGGIGTWEWDLQSDRMVWSDQMFRVLGQEPSEHHDLKRLLLDCVHPDERRTAEDALAAFRSRPGPLRMEVRVLWPKGTTRWIVFLGRVIADPRGTPIRMLGITIDGTSRRQGEDAIREDGERLRLAMQAGGLATWEFNQQNQMRYWSPEAAVMHGFPADKTEISRAEWRRMVHPDDLPMVRTEFAKVLQGLSDYSVEYRVVRPDGEVRWTAVNGTYLRDSDTGRVIGVLQDITERKRTEELLRESEARLNMATEAAGIGIWDWNLRDNSMRYSELAKKICGFPANEPVTYVMVRDVTHPEDFPRTSVMAQRALDPTIRDNPTFEYRLLLPDGRVRWVTASGHAVFAEVDGVMRGVRYLGTIQDITDRKNAEQALVESESRLRLAMDAGRMAAWEHDVATDSLTGSPALLRLFGFDEGESPTIAEMRARYAPGEADRLRTISQAAVERGDRFIEAEFGYLWSDGSTHWMMLRAEFIMKEGSVVRTIGVVADVTDRRTIETAFRQSEGHLRELLATIDLAAVFVRGFDGPIRFWSKGCERLYGWTEEEAVGQSSHKLLDTVFPVPFVEIEATLLKQGKWSGDVLHRRRDRTVITVAMHKVLRRDSEGQPAAILESVSDVTALRKMEADLRTLNQDLEYRVRTEVAAREAAQARAAHAERLQALGQLAGGIAHDFNNVLQGIQTGASLMGRRATDATAVRRFSGLIQDAAERGASITRRLLAFARRGDLRAEVLALGQLLDGLREVLMPALGASIQLSIEVSSSLAPVLADKGQLETALVNLAINARDAMPAGGMLKITAKAEDVSNDDVRHPAGIASGRYIRITVTDTGEGMDAATLGRVLEPFFTTKPPGQGTGLGLPMVKGFAEQSGGGITIESQPGRGTTVSVWLPQAVGESQAEVAADAQGRASPTSRVLLVDDDALIRELLAAEFDELGFEMLVAQSGEEALALLSAGERVDALVSDLSMPEMDGVTLIRAAQAQRPNLPAVLLTGYAGDGTALAVSGAMSGSFTLLRKPVSGAQIAERVVALVKSRNRVH